MSSTIPVSPQQTEIDELTKRIKLLQASIEEKSSKGKKLQAVLAHKCDTAVANNIRKQLDIPRSS